MLDEFASSRVTPAERHLRAGHRPVVVWLAGNLDLAYVLERKLFDRGCLVHVVNEVDRRILGSVLETATDTGLISICAVDVEDESTRDEMKRGVGNDRFLAVNAARLPENMEDASDAICRTLEEKGYIRPLPKPFIGGAGI